jgi:phosphopentomutase
MDEIKKIIDELGITTFEANMKIAGFAVVSDSGKVVFQTDNWDLTNQTNMIFNIIKGDRSFVLNDVEFSIVETTSEGIVATADSGMGHVIFTPFQGGVLVSYAMPRADPLRTLPFLKTFAMRLNGKV